MAGKKKSVSIALALALAALSGSLAAQEEAELLPKAGYAQAWKMSAWKDAGITTAKDADGSIRIAVGRKTPSDRGPGAFIAGVRLTDGARYVLRFSAKSNAEQSYSLFAKMMGAPYSLLSPVFTANPGKTFKDFEFSFVAGKGASKGPAWAPFIDLSGKKGTLWIKNLSLKGPMPRERAKKPVPQGFFAYESDWKDASPGSALDISRLNEAPAGKNGRIVSRDGHFYEEKTGNRVRFFGFTSYYDTIIEKADAEIAARRYAKAGVNLVRFVALDLEDSYFAYPTLYDPAASGHTAFNADSLDKFDYFVYQLKRNGIYVSLVNMAYVSMGEGDGIPAAAQSIPFNFNDRVNVFDQAMRKYQRENARRFLSHVNPYTGKSYAEDECVASLACLNEDSLLDYWDNRLGARLDELPAFYKDELRGLWNAWLAGKYGDDEALASAWLPASKASGSLIGSNRQWQSFMPDSSWLSVKQSTARKPGPAKNLELDVKKTDVKEPWNVKVGFSGIKLADGGRYTLSFRGKADRERPVSIYVFKDVPDYHPMGLDQTVGLSDEWKDIRISFTARDAGKDRAFVALNLGAATGKIWIEDFNLSAGLKDAVLGPGESLGAGTIPIPAATDKQRRDDWIDFLVDTERSWIDEMRSLVRDELGYKGLFLGSQMNYGGTTGYYREELSDYADCHMYWQMPYGSNGAGPSNDNWNIANASQVKALADRNFEVLGWLAMQRRADKPFSVSEYEYASTNDFCSESLPLISSWGAYQDWDSILTYNVDIPTEYESPDHMTDFFDLTNQSSKWSFYPLAAMVFRQALIPAAESKAVLDLAPRPWKRFEYVVPAWDALMPAGSFNFLSRAFMVRPSTALDPIAKDGIGTNGKDADPPIVLKQMPRGKVWLAESDQAVMCAGFIGASTVKAKDLEINAGAFGNNHASVGLVSLDGNAIPSSSRLLLCVAGRTENQGISWNADRSTFGADWGYGPVITERIPARLSVRRDGAGRVWALDSRGDRVKEVKTEYKGGYLVFNPMAEADALLFEIE